MKKYVLKAEAGVVNVPWTTSPCREGTIIHGGKIFS